MAKDLPPLGWLRTFEAAARQAARELAADVPESDESDPHGCSPEGFPCAGDGRAGVLGALAALVNAPLEEIARRGAYLAVGRWNVFAQLFGVFLFAMLHVPLMSATGVTFGASAVAIVGSTYGLGFIWALAAYRTGAIGWPVVGHLAVNLVALPSLIAANTDF